MQGPGNGPIFARKLEQKQEILTIFSRQSQRDLIDLGGTATMKSLTQFLNQLV